MRDTSGQSCDAGDDTIATVDDTSSDAVLRAMPQPGDRVGRYTIGAPIGAGGMGAVFVAHDPDLDRRIALKVIRPDRGDSEAAIRLVREAQSLARLEHPGVVSVFEVGRSEAHTFIAMEYVRGQTLAQWQVQDERTLDEIVDAYVQAGRGLAAAHAVEIVHRDFKPTNVLRGDDGRVRVLDFGIATLATTIDAGARHPTAQRITGPQTVTALTRAGDVLGTPAYMAPEQSEGAAADVRSDQYSFCVALYEAVYRRRPFSGDTLADMHAAKRAGEIERPPTGARRVPIALHRVIARGLRPDPASRWPSMKALLDAIARSRQRRWTWVAGILAVPGGVAAITLAGDPEPCEPPADAFTGVWDDDARARLARRLLDSGLPEHEDVLARAVPAIDRWVDAWSSAWRDACLDARAEPGRGDAALDLRMTCLRRRQSALQSMASLWWDADADVLREAGRAAASLPRVEDCAADRFVDAPALPADPAVAERVQALQDRLGNADALEVAGHYEAALQIARDVLSQAESIDHPPVRLEASLSVGRLLGRMPRLDEAVALLEQTVHEAAAIEHRSVETRAATVLVYLVGHSLERDEDGQRWARHALAAHAAGDLDETHRATILTNLGSVHFAFGRFDEALAAYSEAGEIRERLLGPTHPETGIVISNRAGVLVQAGRLQDAVAEYGRVIEIWERGLGPRHPHVALALNGLGAVYERLRRFDEAIPLARRAVDIRRAALGPDHPELATALETLGSLNFYTKRWDEADALFRESLQIRQAALPPGHVHLGGSWTNAAMLAQARGRHDEAVAAARQAVAIFEPKLGPSHPYLAYAITAWGESALALGDTDEAVALLERAHAIRTATPTAGPDLALTELALARAIDPADPSRAAVLARSARDRLAADPAADPDLRARIDAWLAARPPPP